MDNVLKIFNYLPTLTKEKNPAVAMIIGLLFGGVGLGIYFKSLLDFIGPVVVNIIVLWKFGSSAELLFCAASAVYGLLRAISSNRQRQLEAKAAVAV